MGITIGELPKECSLERAKAKRKHFWVVPNQIDNIIDAFEELQP